MKLCAILPSLVFCFGLSFTLTGCSNGGSAASPTPPPVTLAVSGVGPASVNAGSSATTITVTGTGFTDSTIIEVNGTAEPTTYSSSTQVTALVPATQLTQGALLPVVARNGSVTSSPSAVVKITVNNPIPVVTLIVPNSFVTGAATANVSLSGSGFVPTTVIQVNGNTRATTFNSATSASTLLTDSDFVAPGVLLLTAVNTSPGGGTSSAQSITVNNPVPGALTLTPSTLVAGAATPTTVAVAGSNFLPSSTVQVNGSARTTSYISATQLNFQLTIADQASTGTLTVAVINRTPGGGISPPATLTLTAPPALHGTVHAGQQPVSGAHVYLFAANTTGYGQPSVPLLDATSTGNFDARGAFVLTDADGNFSIARNSSCFPDSQLYLYASEGDAGQGVNPALSEMAVLGTCPASGNFLSLPSVLMNEVTTVATAYALSGFAIDTTHISASSTLLGQTGMANAFTNAGNLASTANGQALATIPAGTAEAPQNTVNSLANILAACDLSSGPTSTDCSTLLSLALSGGTSGSVPTETANAIINIAHHPGINSRALYSLISANPPFTPGLIFAPSDFALGLLFRFESGKTYGPIAVDGAGSVWLNNISDSSVIKISSSGVFLSGAAGFTSTGLLTSYTVALDDAGNAWLTSFVGGGSVVEFSNSGTVLSGVAGYTAGGLQQPRRLAMDGTGSAWVTTEGGNVVKLSSSGTSLSGSAGFSAPGMQRSNAIAIDDSGSPWISTLSGYETLFKLSNSGSLLSGTNGYSVPGASDAPSIAIDHSGNAWTLSANTVVKVSNKGTPLLTVSENSGPQSIAIDGDGNAWTANISGGAVVGLSNSGSILSGEWGYNGGFLTNPIEIALDGSGDIWVLNDLSLLTELIGASVPVVTPLATGVKNNTLGTRP